MHSLTARVGERTIATNRKIAVPENLMDITYCIIGWFDIRKLSEILYYKNKTPRHSTLWKINFGVFEPNYFSFSPSLNVVLNRSVLFTQFHGTNDKSIDIIEYMHYFETMVWLCYFWHIWDDLSSSQIQF